MSSQIEFDHDVSNVGLRIGIQNELDGTSTELYFESFPVRVGRNRTNDLVLFHEYVSNWHAVVGFLGGILSIVQVGKSNSVRINERKLLPNEAAPITPNDSVRIVPFSLSFQLVPTQSSSAVQHPGTMMFDEVQAGSGGPGHGTGDAALTVLNRLADRYLGQELQNPAEVAHLGQRLETTLDDLLGFVMALRKAHEQFQLRIGLRPNSQQLGALARAADATELGAALLSPVDRGGEAALGELLGTLRVHQVALMKGFEAGLKALLAQLSPRAIAKLLGGKKFGLGGGAKALWEAYQRQFANCAEDEAEVFKIVYGTRFRRVYRELLETSGRDRG